MGFLKKFINAYRTRTLHRKLYWKLLRLFQPHKAMIVPIRSGAKLRIYAHDVIGEEIFVKGAFEPDSFACVSGYLKPGMVVFDLGANLGQYTVLAGQRVGPMGKVHSFEPCKRMFEQLNFNINLNGLQNVCCLNKVAVSESSAVASLCVYEPGAEVYNSMGKHKRAGAKIVGHENVETITLDDYCLKHNIGRVDFIKIDIEGAELPALKGGKQLLSRRDAPVILLEMADINTIGFGYSALDIWEFLEGFGYTMHSLDMRPISKPVDFRKASNLVAKKY